ncbi:hypothetical protein Y032_0308g2045 [Ancylostoma ceylanicum]|uniref:Secreted protein n=1 Tax=Ancylostoma ceylanicum TaxID=53326 RepID=A0A016S3F4_9BILA|nr:hypothetical protein Y032_0308g2045 [Ancylostoma ceylanicum]
MIRSIILLFISGKLTLLSEILTESWLYEVEIEATLSVWIQLLINVNLRQQMFKTFSTSKATKPNRKSAFTSTSERVAS